MFLDDSHRVVVLQFVRDELNTMESSGAFSEVPFEKSLPQDAGLAETAHLCQVKRSISSLPEVTDAINRLEMSYKCEVFNECHLPQCMGESWCSVYNGGVGQTHMSRRLRDGDLFGEDVPFTRKEMLKILQET